MGWMQVGEDWNWVASPVAMWTLGAASIIEIGAYYIPWLDNALDSISVPLATVAGTLVMAGVLLDFDPVATWALAIISGGGTAASMAALTTGTRAVSTTTTGGLANPILSTAEAGGSILLTLTSIFLPIVAGVIVLILLWLAWKVYIRLAKRRQA